MNDAELLKYADHLQKSCYQAVGFLPRQALSEYIERGQIIPASEGGEPCGFMTFFDGRNGKRPKNDPHTIRIYQIAIQDDARRIYHGTGLISRLLYHAALNDFTRLGLWCATDLPANAFWRALGFTQDKTRIGGNKDGRLHDHWYLDVPAPRTTTHAPRHSSPNGN